MTINEATELRWKSLCSVEICFSGEEQIQENVVEYKHTNALSKEKTKSQSSDPPRLAIIQIRDSNSNSKAEQAKDPTPQEMLVMFPSDGHIIP